MISVSPRATRPVFILGVAALAACTDQPNATAPRLVSRAHLAVGDVLTVTNLNGGDDPGSLRVVINQATGGEIIHFDPSLAGGTIALDSTLVIPLQITIEAPTTKGITIKANGTFRVLDIRQGARLVNVSITGGQSIQTEGAGILSTGPLTLEHSTVFGNKGPGIKGNIIELVNSTVADNDAGKLADNVTGGILYDGSTGALSLINSTVARNTPGGIRPFGNIAPGLTVLLQNSIIALNGFESSFGFDVFNCANRDGFVFKGKNLSDGGCGDAGDNVIVSNPLLESLLADNGGPTPTIALTRSSPAIDRGLECTETVDQRFVTRDARCDLGAFEFVPTSISLTIDPNAVVDAKTGVLTLRGTVACSRADAFDLAITVTQDQRVRHSGTSATATATTPMRCGTSSQPWIALVPPSSGEVFETGPATANAATVSAVGIVPTSATATLNVSRLKK